MVDREATMVRVDRVVLLEVEDEVGQAHEDAKDSVDSLGRKSFPFWHILVDVRLGGGGCREDFRPRAENRERWANRRCVTLAHIRRKCG